MGVFSVKAKVWNIADKSKLVEAMFIVDTGATYTLMPSSALKALGVKPIRSAKLRLADSKLVEKPIGEIAIEIDGYSASATPVIFGEKGVHLLGATTMEQLGLAPDPIEKKLKPAEALLMNQEAL